MEDQRKSNALPWLSETSPKGFYGIFMTMAGGIIQSYSGLSSVCLHVSFGLETCLGLITCGIRVGLSPLSCFVFELCHEYVKMSSFYRLLSFEFYLKILNFLTFFYVRNH